MTTGVRAEADELVPVAFTVNGTAVQVAVPPRMTLADTLRERLGLTGTHLGCEHGVCGMCTVLLDGDAARSCLLFAVQCAGAEIVTIEGMAGTDGAHPLQQAFSHHHALQCGFCTPAFVLSAYELLRDHPDLPRDQLPEELSGVLCRCTGYRNILAAVADVADRYPGGVPAPMGCGERTLVGRRREPAPASAPPSRGTAAPVDVAVPTGAPTVTVELTSRLGAPASEVWAVLDDPARLAACLPGAELTETVGEDRYRGRVRVALGPVRLSFEGQAHVAERDAGGHRMRVIAAGVDAGSNRAQADIRLHAEPRGGGTDLSAHAALYLSGRIAQFGRALAGDVSHRLFEQFARAVDRTATTGKPAAPAAAPNALRLAVGVVAAGARRATGRLLARVRMHRRP